MAATLTSFAECLDGVARRIDGWFGGTGKLRCFGQRSLQAFILPIPVCFFVIFGPTALCRTVTISVPGVLVTLFAVLAVELPYFLVPRIRRFGRMRSLHLLLIALAAGIAWSLGGHDGLEANSLVYRSYYPPVACIAMVLATIAAPWLSRVAWFRLSSDDLKAFKGAFNARRLVQRRPRLPSTGADFWRALFLSFLHTPLHVLAIPALGALLIPAGWLTAWVASAGLVSLAIATTANYDPDFDGPLSAIRRTLLTGATLLVTIVAIVLAGLRIARVSYVTTVLDAGGAGVLFSYLLSTYTLLWLYDFWTQQSAVDCLGDLEKLASKTTLSRHGGGRLAVCYENQTRVFTPAQLLRAITETADLSEAPTLRIRAERTEARLAGFNTITMALLLGFFTALMIVAHGEADGPHASEEEEPRRNDPANHVRLEKLMTDKGADKPVFFVAASGGGTRAAVYAAAVLHGLARLQVLDRVVAVSGVSGGSAALAYFTAFREKLVNAGNDRWRQMRLTLAESYFSEVLAGAGEWRMFGAGRLGQLLTESLERHFQSGVPVDAARLWTLGHAADHHLVVMFNAGLCGEGVVSDVDPPNSINAGGFVVMTNLDGSFERPEVVEHLGWELHLPMKVIARPELRLPRAAALSANFPPVFSNAAINADVPTPTSTDQPAPPADGMRRRFWVTDGGAVENRAAISLLLALLDALQQFPRGKNAPVANLPSVRLVMAEASAVNDAYSSDRGAGAAFGASTQIANALTNSLARVVNDEYRRLTDGTKDLKIVYVPMPVALRAAGTFGTHWMMPPVVPLGSIHAADNPVTLPLDREFVLDLIDAMFQADLSADAINTDWKRTDGKEIIARLGDPLWPKFEAAVRQ